MRYLRLLRLRLIRFQKCILQHHILGTEFQRYHTRLRRPSFRHRSKRFRRIPGIVDQFEALHAEYGRYAER